MTCRSFLFAVLLLGAPAAWAQQEGPRQLNTLPQAAPTPVAAPDTVRPQLAPPPTVSEAEMRQQQRQRQMQSLPPANTTRYAVGLKSGQVYRAYDVEIKQPVFGRNFLLLDGQQRIDFDQVRYYEDETGFYVRTTLPKSRREATLRRDRVGRLSLYSITRTQYAGGSPFGYSPFGYGGFGMPYGGGFGGYPYGGYRTVKTTYFSKENGPVQDLNIRNLGVAVSDNAGASALLAQARRYQTITTLSYVAAGGLLVAGLVSSFNPNPGQSAVSPLVYAGIPLLIVPLVLQGKQQNSIRQAITIYNSGNNAGR
ncbi:hypothetical protein [Hymenobacter profundi]|uniref:Uncharacterized protein n=1 Tax=Hymenobacter profundi TaxID=1982110 RepID=A0ABS6X320_9BACT|nr:hypothetical protein [Hymenobacter profundi]MBW3129887.1 hypothetical protein [Hymenobacter profundi]